MNPNEQRMEEGKGYLHEWKKDGKDRKERRKERKWERKKEKKKEMKERKEKEKKETDWRGSLTMDNPLKRTESP